MEEQNAPSRRSVVTMGAVTVLGVAGTAACSDSGSATSVQGLGTSAGQASPAGPSSDTATSVASPTDTGTGGATSAAGTTAPASSPAGAATTKPATTKATTQPAQTTTKAAQTTKPATTKPATTQPPQTTKPATTKATTPPANTKPAGALIELADIPSGGSVVPEGTNIVIYRSGGSVVGHSAACTHQGCTVLAGGRTLNCPCHGSKFDAATGAVLADPATRPLPSRGVRVVDGWVVAG